jgi:hydrogenase large subunit
VAATYALADLAETTPPANAQYALNLLLACENLADLLTHFYIFFMPDFARAVYAPQAWYSVIAERFTAIKGSATAQVLPARAAFMQIMGIIGGHWPHTLSLQVGGLSKALTQRELMQLLSLVQQFRVFLETVLFGDTLENIANLRSLVALETWRDQQQVKPSDFALFLTIAQSLDLAQLGRANDHFLSYGAYRQPDAQGFCFKQGVWQAQQVQAVPFDTISEDLHVAWLQGNQQALHPSQGVTLPHYPKNQAYSWSKAPRLAGAVVETGALARQLVNGQPLIQALVQQSGGNVQNRIVARLLELALIVPQMEQWLKQIRPQATFYHAVKLPSEGAGVGLVEAARGSLGHWLSVRNKHILNYQIIAPTTWNFSPRDQQGQAGALEQALVNAPIQAGETDPMSVQHIVRSFDPCMVCTAH